MSPTNGRRNYFRKTILVLKIFGVSLTGNESLPYKMYSFLFLALTVFTYPFLGLYELFKHDANIIADIVIYQMGAILVLPSVAVVLRNRIKFGKLLTKLEQEPFIPILDRGGAVEEELFAKCIRLTGAQTLFLGGSTFVTLTSILIFTAMKRMTSNDYHDWQMPFGPLTLLNVTYTPSFEITWLYQSISYVFMSSLCIAIDLLLIAVLAHISYQFKILQNFLSQMVKNSEENMMEVQNGLEQYITSNEPITSNETDGSNIPWKYLKKCIIEAVRYHVAIIDIAKETDEIFSELLLFTFLGTLAMLCFSTYNASSAGSLQSAGKHLGMVLVIIARVALVCFWGEEVFEESQLVGQAAYESNFVGTDLKFQKMLAFIIRRGQNPIKMTAGKFTDIRLTTLFWILRTSYSAFMVLRRSKI